MRRPPLLALTFAALAAVVWAGAADPVGAQRFEFSLKEKQIIVEFYGGGDAGKGKGKKNKGKGVGNTGMPPGLAKKGKLPPGIAKRQLPSALIAQLPPPPRGYERVIVDNDILLVHIATQVIHDILIDVMN